MSPNTNTPAVAERIRADSKAQVSVGGETLVISKVHMWRNDQPRVSSIAEEAERSSSPKILSSTNLTLTIRRKGATSAAGTADSNGLDSSALPYVLAVHVLREGSSVGESVTAPDDPTATHFVWAAPPATTAAAATTAAVEPAHEGAYFLATVMDGGSALGLNAWNGPTWNTLRNGIDDMIDFVAVVEFQGGILLASEKHRVEVVY